MEQIGRIAYNTETGERSKLLPKDFEKPHDAPEETDWVILDVYRGDKPEYDPLTHKRERIESIDLANKRAVIEFRTVALSQPERDEAQQSDQKRQRMEQINNQLSKVNVTQANAVQVLQGLLISLGYQEPEI